MMLPTMQLFAHFSSRPSIRISKRSEEKAHQWLVEYIYDHCGIQLGRDKEAFVKTRLGKRMRQAGVAHLSEYCQILQTDQDEMQHAIDALTTNFTNFLREEEHFQFMVKTALPGILSPGKTKFRVWSAASSSGEEPYSIAFYLDQFYPLSSGWDWEITASDISLRILEKAKQAIYPADCLRTVPPAWQAKYLNKGVRTQEGNFKIKDYIVQRVQYQQINLIKSFRHSRPFEIIFCRNVMIYFDKPTQEQIVKKLMQFLVPGGYLFVGHSESLCGLQIPLKRIKPSVYQAPVGR